MIGLCAAFHPFVDSDVYGIQVSREVYQEKFCSFHKSKADWDISWEIQFLL